MDILCQIRKEIESSQEVMNPWFLRYQDILHNMWIKIKMIVLFTLTLFIPIIQAAMAVEQSDSLNVVMMPRRELAILVSLMQRQNCKVRLRAYVNETKELPT